MAPGLGAWLTLASSVGHWLAVCSDLLCVGRKARLGAAPRAWLSLPTAGSRVLSWWRLEPCGRKGRVCSVSLASSGHGRTA